MRQPGLRWLLATALWLGTAAAASASSGGSSGGSSGVSGSSSESDGSNGGCRLNVTEAKEWCRLKPYMELKEHLGTDQAILACCDKICPNWRAEDFLQTCSAHTYHSAYTEWQEEAHHQSALQWNVFFVAFCLLLGAFFKQFLPAQVPYTVGLLLVFMLFGLLGQFLSDNIMCPSHAWCHSDDTNPCPCSPPTRARNRKAATMPLHSPLPDPTPPYPNPAAPTRTPRTLDRLHLHLYSSTAYAGGTPRRTTSTATPSKASLRTGGSSSSATASTKIPSASRGRKETAASRARAETATQTRRAATVSRISTGPSR